MPPRNDGQVKGNCLNYDFYDFLIALIDCAVIFLSIDLRLNSLWDMMGKILRKKSLSNITAGYNVPIDLSGYAKGVYMVYLQVDGDNSYKKLIVE